MLAALAGALGVASRRCLRAGPVARVLLLLAILLPAARLRGAALRSRLVAAPVLPYEMTANVEGRIVDLDRSASERPRVLLDRVVIHGLEPERTPARVRISLDPATPRDLLRPGLRLLGQARLVAAGGAVGAGRLRLPPARLVRADRRGRLCADADARDRGLGRPGGWRQLAFRMRMAASAHIQRLVPGQDGAFTSAILTGDRSGIDRSVEAALRISSLYHIVSISGLHMTLLAAAVFAMIRYGLALVPRLALIWPLKKIAAGGGAGRRARPTW